MSLDVCLWFDMMRLLVIGSRDHDSWGSELELSLEIRISVVYVWEGLYVYVVG